MGFFDKKYCDVCGEKIGLLGNRKLEDGNLCKDCAKQLSPFFDDRRNSTVEEIKAQLAYREQNKQKVAEFNPTKVIGSSALICIDEDKQQWLFTRKKNWKETNPDIIDFSQVTGCDLDVHEMDIEVYTKDREGKTVSYSPRRYKQHYDFKMTIHVNSPWFNDIDFKLNNRDIEGKYSFEYREAEKDAQEIIDILTNIRDSSREAKIQANAPKQAVVCPNCSATTTPNQNGRCEYCGGAC